MAISFFHLTTFTKGSMCKVIEQTSFSVTNMHLSGKKNKKKFKRLINLSPMGGIIIGYEIGRILKKKQFSVNE